MLTCRYGQATMEKTFSVTRKYLECEGELYIPEKYPELEAVLSVHGYLEEITGEIRGDKLVLSGTVETHLVYRGKESLDRVPECGIIRRGTEGAVFNGEVNLPEQGENWDWHARLVKIKLQPETARSLKYQLTLEIELRARRPVQTYFIEEIEADPLIHTEVEQFLIEEPVIETYVRREVDADFSLSYPKPPLARVLNCQVSPLASTATHGKDRVNIEGKLEVELLYVSLTEDGREGGLELQKWTEENGRAIPFQISVEAPMLTEPSIQYDLWIEGVQVSSAHPESCRVEARIGARVSMAGRKQVRVVTDGAPAGDGIIDLLREESEWVEVVEEAERSFVVEKLLALPAERPNIARVLQMIVTEPKFDWQLAHEQLMVGGEAIGTLLYQAENGEGEEFVFTSAGWGSGGTEPLTFGAYLELPGVEEGNEARVGLYPQQLKVEQVDERTIRLVWEFKALITVFQTRRFSLVRDAALVLPDEGPKPSMLFYLVQPGDTLWKIARRYKTTMAAIAKANQLTAADQELGFGKKLLIPKDPFGK